MKPAAPKWESEAAMLTAFAVEARAMGFRVVPEACGHDLILVVGPEGLRMPDHREPPAALCPGDTIAVEGKLRPSLEVLYQALPPDRTPGWSWACHHPTGLGGVERCGTCPSCRSLATRRAGRAADFYAVVIPEAPMEFRALAEALGIGLFVMRPARPKEDWRPAEPPSLGFVDFEEHQRVIGREPLQVPDLDVALTPGLPAPRKLTPWKIAAVRLCVLGRTRDLTLEDFANHAPVSARTFVDQRWATLVGRNGRAGIYRLVDSASRPDRAYPEIVAAIEAQAAAAATPALATPVRPLGALFGGGAA